MDGEEDFKDASQHRKNEHDSWKIVEFSLFYQC